MFLKDYGEMRDYFKTTCRKDMKEVDLCVKGWNWGETTINGSLLSFMVDSKRAFEVPLKEVSQVCGGCEYRGTDSVVLLLKRYTALRVLPPCMLREFPIQQSNDFSRFTAHISSVW